MYISFSATHNLRTANNIYWRCCVMPSGRRSSALRRILVVSFA
jgi:hypothetical protein